MNAETVAQLFHETYERLAPDFGYTTRPETAIPWEQIPADSANKRLVIAVAGEVLAAIASEEADLRQIIADFDTLCKDVIPYTYEQAFRTESLRERVLRVLHAESTLAAAHGESGDGAA